MENKSSDGQYEGNSSNDITVDSKDVVISQPVSSNGKETFDQNEPPPVYTLTDDRYAEGVTTVQPKPTQPPPAYASVVDRDGQYVTTDQPTTQEKHEKERKDYHDASSSNYYVATGTNGDDWCCYACLISCHHCFEDCGRRLCRKCNCCCDGDNNNDDCCGDCGDCDCDCDCCDGIGDCLGSCCSGCGECLGGFCSGCGDCLGGVCGACGDCF